MTQQEIHDAAYNLIFEESGSLPRPEYESLLHDIIDDCKAALQTLNEDEQE